MLNFIRPTQLSRILNFIRKTFCLNYLPLGPVSVFDTQTFVTLSSAIITVVAHERSYYYIDEYI